MAGFVGGNIKVSIVIKNESDPENQDRSRLCYNLAIPL